MNNFNFYAPTYFSFGKDTEKETGGLVKRFGGSKVLIHYGGGSIKKNGVLDKVVKSLNDNGISHVELGGVMPNPRSGLVYEGIELCRKEGVDFILAVGGGSAIDSAKAIAAGVPYDGDFWDFFAKGVTIERALPVATVLTIAAAGSEGSNGMVITHEDEMNKWAAGSEVLRPAFSILNPESTCTLPAYQTACGITDIMAHVCERYFTNTTNVEITDRLCEGILKAVIAEAPKVIANPNDYEARANIMWAGTVAHNDTCGVGRGSDWCSHALEHELSSLYDVAHGAGLAVMVPAWMTYVINHNVMRSAQFAVRVWDCDMNFENPEITAREGIEKFRNFLSSIGMPRNFADIDAKASDIPKLIEHIGFSDTKSLGGYVKVGAKEATEIYTIAAEA